MRASPMIISLLLISVIEAFNCSRSLSCQQELEKFRIEEIKSTILSQLQLTGPPDVSKLPSPQLREEYRRLAEEMDADADSFEAKETETTFVPARDPSAGEDRSQLVATFDVTDNLREKKLVEAKLLFQVNPVESHARDVQVQVFEKNEDSSLGELVVSQTLSVSGKQRVGIQLPAESVERWYTTSPISGLFVSATIDGHNVAIHPQQTSDDFENMILQLTIEKGNKRSRRTATPICTSEKPSDGCCLYDLMIDFHKIGWEWIVAPPRYNAYMCRGNCKLNSHHYSLSENGHTKIMKAAYRMGDDVKAKVENVGFCCHATEYEYIKLIYVNRDGRVSVANVNGMIARKCACS